MKMFIPKLGTKLELTEDWNFVLYDESRNDTLTEYLKIDFKTHKNVRNLNHPYWFVHAEVDVMLPLGTVLKVDRIYIKKGNESFDSVSLYAIIPNEKKMKRFWVKLDDFNKIEAYVLED